MSAVELQAFLVCDGMVRDASTGKAYVQGIFDTVLGDSFPLTHHSMALYFRLKAEAAGTVELERDAERRRQIGAAIAAAGAAYQQQTRPQPISAPAPQTFSPPGCSSDYQCQWGQTCVKQNYSTSGFCADRVNEYGVKQYMEAPRLDSVNPKWPSATDCKFDTQCPVGFRCDAASGACLRR